MEPFAPDRDLTGSDIQRPRASVRRYAVLIILIAAGSYGFVVAKSRSWLLGKVAHHARQEVVWRQHPNSSRMLYENPDGSVGTLDFLDGSVARSTVQRWSKPVKVLGYYDAQAMVAFHAGLKAKFGRAVWRPWSALAPDPPLAGHLSEPTSLFRL